MNKRKRNLDGDALADTFLPYSKRVKLGEFDSLSRLSDELLIRVLGLLRVRDLIQCQRCVSSTFSAIWSDRTRVSRRFDTLTTDTQLWKSLYYDHFVRPRAARIPGISSSALIYSSRQSNWLDDRHLLRDNTTTDWKAQYRLRKNWTNGSPKTSGFLLPGHSPPILPLIRMQGNHAVAVDPQHGLRAWRVKGHAALIATQPLDVDRGSTPHTRIKPSSLALDAQAADEWPVRALVGFEDGSWCLQALQRGQSHFLEIYRQPFSSHGSVIAASYAHPYIATLNADHRLSVYVSSESSTNAEAKMDNARLLCTLSSHTVQSPLSVSLRVLTMGLIACIAFVAPSYSTGWNVGVQELHVGFDGQLTESRVTIAAPTNLLSTRIPTRRKGVASEQPPLGYSQAASEASKPSSLSYSHPYLLVAHPDNTLSVHLVKSSSSHLSISGGHRLWGHTSSVSDAQVGSKGKAISASMCGDEVRVWDLEGLVSSRKQDATVIMSKSIQPRLDFALKRVQYEPPETTLRRDHRVVGFDLEKIVTMCEARERALIVYDFS